MAAKSIMLVKEWNQSSSTNRSIEPRTDRAPPRYQASTQGRGKYQDANSLDAVIAYNEQDP